jgi:hypothetical protein
MRCGRLWAAKTISSGFSWHWMSRREKLSGCMSDLGVERVPRNYGMHCQQCIDNARLLIPIFGQLMRRSFRTSDIKVWVKTVAKPATLSGLTAHCANECRVYSGKRYRSLKRWRILSGQFSISFSTTMILTFLALPKALPRYS